MQYQSFPYNKNGFKVGMKLEGVDPEHQSIYCVLTVAEVSKQPQCGVIVGTEVKQQQLKTLTLT